MKVCLVLLLLLNLNLKSQGIEETKSDCSELSRSEEPLLVLSTLSGELLALDPLTAETRWIQQDEQNVKANTNINDYMNSIYLPDPTTGYLYKLQNDGDNGNELKKLPYTIPELVQRSPCKSSEGILFSGKKSDSWFMIDPLTGNREHVMGFGAPPSKKSSESIGFATSRAIYLGRTQYTVQMFDSMSSVNGKPWNITFFDYNSHTMDPEISKKYEFIHVTSSTSGRIVTMNRKSGEFLWEKNDINSPIVSIFLLGRDGLLSVPFTTVAEDVIDKVVDFSKNNGINDFQLYETVFVGESKGSSLRSDTLYAIPSYVDDNTPTIKKNSMNLLEGPKSRNIEPKEHKSSNKKNYIIFGHYENPTTEKIFDTIGKGSDKAITVRNDRNIWYENTGESDDKVELIIPSDNRDGKVMKSNNVSKVIKHDEIAETKQNNNSLLKKVFTSFKNWFDNEENKILKLLMVILIGTFVMMVFYFQSTVRELRQSQNGSKTKIPRSGDSNGSYTIVESVEGDELIEVGKITFNPREVLGKGCEGTFVFKGTFEKREVAVKRLLPDCFTLADREVALLRESDTHENVVRYFCTEADRQFRYIAVELCQATLQDFIEGKNSSELRQLISMKEVLYQATSGLSHLHHLNIVHRDIKPQNVLISLPDNKKRVRALISDFGLCKKMNLGKASFSKRSGVTGTDGWIAPEMIKGHRTTISVDIFSMGCVYYYVLSNGDHLFGDTIKRQANILSNEYDMKKLMTQKKKPYENILAAQLIQEMVGKDSNKRPNADAVLKHPMFWREEKILAFLQDVSDRIEKLDIYTDPLKTLERNAKFIIKDDWKSHLDESIREDLRKHRDYHCISVRDLLRALRNKKHHFHELSPDIQRTLGTPPCDFVRYWIFRFPHLISHTFHSMETCSKEASFRRYYSPNFTFAKPEYLFDEDLDNEELRDLYETSRALYNKSPKKENRQPNNNGNKQIEKSKRGTYNFNSPNNQNQPANNSAFITREEMQKVTRRKNTQEEKIVWTNPK